jgi:hypothetical protein
VVQGVGPEFNPQYHTRKKNLTKETKNLFNENCKSMKREIKEDIRR